jgi:uncharacterized protein (DUF302 family)
MSQDPAYGHTVRLPGVSFDDARTRITDALKQEGVGVLTEIDVKATMKAKLDVEFRRYVILGACNPHLAHKALSADLGIGLLLPCNVCVWEDEEGSVVSVIRPDAMFSVVKTAGLAPVVEEADRRLTSALARVRQA